MKRTKRSQKVGVDMFFDALDEGTGVEGTVSGERNEDVV
jgi:hypothetical protein